MAACVYIYIAGIYQKYLLQVSILLYSVLSVTILSKALNRYAQDPPIKGPSPFQVAPIIIVIIIIFVGLMQSNFELGEYLKISRETRQELFFNSTKTAPTNLLIALYSPVVHIFFLVFGTISKKKNIVLTSAVMAISADLVTDGRANVLTWILTYAFLFFVLRNQSTLPSVKNLLFILSSFFVFLFAGQGELSEAVSLRALNYLVAPVSMSAILSVKSELLFNSLIESIVITSSFFKDGVMATSHEHKFFPGLNGIPVNVVIPSYAFLTKFGLFFAWVAASVYYIGQAWIISLFLGKHYRKIFLVSYIIVLFGPTNFYRSVLLQEASLIFLNLVLVLSVLLGKILEKNIRVHR